MTPTLAPLRDRLVALRARAPRRPATTSTDGDRRDAATTRWWALLPAVDVDGPKVRLGVVWAALSFVAVLLGPVATALVFAPVALGAAGQATRSWRRSDRRPYRPVAVIGAVVCALAGSAGPLAVVAAAAFASVAAVTAEQLRFGGRAWDARVTIAITVIVGVGAATPALVVEQLGLIPAIVLVSSVHVVDASTFIVGSGARSRWEGPVAGAASAAAFSVAVAALFVPPFRGSSPWVLGALVATGVPAGAIVATTLLGRREAPAPALRRLDGYLVTGPVWILAGRLLLDLA